MKQSIILTLVNKMIPSKLGYSSCKWFAILIAYDLHESQSLD